MIPLPVSPSTISRTGSVLSSSGVPLRGVWVFLGLLTAAVFVIGHFLIGWQPSSYSPLRDPSQLAHLATRAGLAAIAALRTLRITLPSFTTDLSLRGYILSCRTHLLAVLLDQPSASTVLFGRVSTVPAPCRPHLPCSRWQ